MALARRWRCTDAAEDPKMELRVPPQDENGPTTVDPEIQALGDKLLHLNALDMKQLNDYVSVSTRMWCGVGVGLG